MIKRIAWFALVPALFAGLEGIAQASLFVSDHELVTDANRYQVLRFDENSGTSSPLTFPITNVPSRGEGIAFGIINGTPTLFVADTAGAINEYDPASGKLIRNFQLGLPSLGGISLSKDGSTLYVAAQSTTTPGNGRIDAFSTSLPNAAPIYSRVTDAAHDVRVGPDGFVYAADPFTPADGVIRCLADLSSCSTFIPSSAISNPTGMTFDRLGNIWVANFPVGQTTLPFGSVFEFDPLGALILEVTSPLFNGPVGLATGPDGNIYVANIRADNVLMIDLSTCSATNCSVNTFIANAGYQPKYPEFTFAAVPEPGTLGLLLLGMWGMTGVVRGPRRRPDQA